MNLINKLEWRYATKAFNPSKKIKEDDLEFIKRSVQLSTSSYGLQLYKILIVENLEIKKQLRAVSHNQAQITEASHLFIFCNYNVVKNSNIDDFILRLADAKNVSKNDLEGYGNFIKEKIFSMDPIELNIWLEKQPYLALGNLLTACAELQIDACPMEGFESDSYNRILNLNSQGLNACVVAAVGYRSETDEYQFHKKVRKPLDQLFECL